MTAEVAPVIAGGLRQVKADRPLALYVAIIRENPHIERPELRKHLRQLLLSPGFEEYLDWVIEEWERLNFKTAKAIATPTSTEELKKKAADRQRASAQEEAAVEKAKALIGERLLAMATPLGKPLRECTGAECVELGGYFMAIGNAVGATEIVGEKLTADAIAKLIERRRR